ncbi:predicted protein [Sclerotinia sclerotiorum 1980 UF-70]|nr:predicted protein [Sclerotinia sclerotiorum 1980 UF-70]EDN94785.1 predicted protein [Sclerotinia sclerotiorum 1980 UF-70]
MPRLNDLHQLIGQSVPQGGYRARVELIQSLYSSMLPPQSAHVLEPVVEGGTEENPPENALDRVPTERLETEQLGQEQWFINHMANVQLAMDTAQRGTEQPGSEPAWI